MTLLSHEENNHYATIRKVIKILDVDNVYTDWSKQYGIKSTRGKGSTGDKEQRSLCVIYLGPFLDESMLLWIAGGTC